MNIEAVSHTISSSKKMFWVEDRGDANAIIDEIYDEMLSRTCANCKHASGNDPRVRACDEGLGWVKPDFGCNKFEPKDEV